jgi:hypothetical protein
VQQIRAAQKTMIEALRSSPSLAAADLAALL